VALDCSVAPDAAMTKNRASGSRTSWRWRRCALPSPAALTHPARTREGVRSPLSRKPRTICAQEPALVKRQIRPPAPRRASASWYPR